MRHESLLATVLKEQHNKILPGTVRDGKVGGKSRRLDEAVRLLDKVHSLEPANLGPALLLVDLICARVKPAKRWSSPGSGKCQPQELGVLAAGGALMWL